MKLTEEELNVIKSQSEKIFNLMSNDHDLSMWFEIDQLLGYKEQFGSQKVDSIDALLAMDINRYLRYVGWVTKITCPTYGEENQMGLKFIIVPQLFVLLNNTYSQTLLMEYSKKHSQMNSLITKTIITSVDLCQLKMKKTLTLHDVENYVEKLFTNMKKLRTNAKCSYKMEFN